MSPGAVVEERVFREFKRLCLSGLDEVTLLREVIARLRHAVPIDTYFEDWRHLTRQRLVREIEVWTPPPIVR